MLTLAAFSLDLPAYACARLRLIAPALTLRGRIDLRWGAASNGRDYAIDPSVMNGADAVVFQRYFPMKQTWPLVEQVLASGIPVIYEVDDNFLAVPPDHPMKARLDPVTPYARELLSRASLITVSCAELARAVSGLAKSVAVLPNLLEERLWLCAPREREEAAAGAPVRVVFAGTPSHAGDVGRIAPALRRVKERCGSGVELVFLGCPAPEGLEARELPFSEDYAAYARALKNLAPDIGLAPLEDTPFNRCKSAVKWLEYSALGAAGVYADLAPYAPVRHGETGLKAGADPDQWEEALMRLVVDASMRQELGGRARAEVLARWGLRAGAEGYFTVWQEAARAGK
ncbi:MAG: glycosyl transferase family 1 [Acidobacteriota bacterium]